jgi:lipoprotein signal peptidase
MKAQKAVTSVGDTPFIGWIGVQIMSQALTKITSGQVTGSTTMKALDGLHVVIPGFLNFTYKFNHSPAFSRISNFNVLTYRVTNGALTPGGTIDTQHAALTAS